mgnify:CR=1 FL=1
MRIEDVFGQILQAGQAADIGAILDDVAKNQGFRAWTYANATRLPATTAEPVPYYITTVPEAFTQDYLSVNAPASDPCLAYAAAARQPFYWSNLPHWHDAQKPRSGPKRFGVRIMQLAFDHNIGDGLIVPIHSKDCKGRTMDTLVTLYAERQSHPETPDPEIRSWLPAILHATNNRMCEIEPGLTGRFVPDHRLTDRECETLRWAARGKTVDETGEILKISERTVEKHLEHAMDKLGAANKAHAVALAITQGVIAL